MARNRRNTNQSWMSQRELQEFGVSWEDNNSSSTNSSVYNLGSRRSSDTSLTFSMWRDQQDGEDLRPENDPSEMVTLMETRRKQRELDEEPEDPEEGGTAQRAQKAIVAICIFLAFMALAHVAASLYLFITPDKYEHPYECLTKNCKTISTWLKEAMDESRDPCDDFYHFVCGKYIANNQPAKSSNKTNSSNEVTPMLLEGIPLRYQGNPNLGKFLKPKTEHPLNQLLPFYKSCIFQKRRDLRGIKPLVNLLAKLKLLYVNRVGLTRPSIPRIVARIYKYTYKMHFVNILPSIDNYMRLRIAKTDTDLKMTPGDVYAKAMKEALLFFKDDLQIQDDDEIDTIVWLVMRFEAELVTIQGQDIHTTIWGFPDTMEKFVQKPEKFHLNYEQNKRTASVRWNDLVEELIGEKETDKHRVIFFSYYYSIMVQTERFYFLIMEQFLRRTPFYVIFRFFQWSLIKSFAFDLTADLSTLMLQIFRWSGSSSDERCFRSLFTNLNALAAERYALEDSTWNETATKMISFTNMLRHYMLNVSQIFTPAMIRKINDTFDTLVILPGDFSSVSKHNKIFYHDLNISEWNYFKNVLHSRAIRARNEIFKVMKVYPYSEWPSFDFSLNDVSLISFQYNELREERVVNVPLGSGTEPYMGNDLPIIDVAGYGYWLVTFYMMFYITNDLLTNEAAWRGRYLSVDTLTEFKEIESSLLPRADCIYESFSKLKVKEFDNITLNAFSPISRVKCVADALSAEFITEFVDTFKDNRTLFPEFQILPGFYHYSPMQLLTQIIARHACKPTAPAQKKYLMQHGPTPFELRINGGFRNAHLFAKAWGCKKNTFMNPPNKCEFFTSYKQEAIVIKKPSGTTSTPGRPK